LKQDHQAFRRLESGKQPNACKVEHPFLSAWLKSSMIISSDCFKISELLLKISQQD
jgi:hypothetical protein